MTDRALTAADHCRDCGRPLRRTGGRTNASGFCCHCRRRHRCSSCGAIFRDRIGPVCPNCAAILTGIATLRPTWFGEGGECQTRRREP